MRTIIEEYGRTIIAALIAAVCFGTILFAVQQFNGTTDVAKNRLADTGNGGYNNTTEFYEGKTAAWSEQFNADGTKNSNMTGASWTLNIEEQARPNLTLKDNEKFYYDREYDQFPYISVCAALYPDYYDEHKVKHTDDGAFSRKNKGDKCLVGTFGYAYLEGTQKDGNKGVPDPNYVDSEGNVPKGWITYDATGHVFSIMHIYEDGKTDQVEDGKTDQVNSSGSSLLQRNANGTWSFIKKNTGDGAHRQYFASVRVTLTINNQTVERTAKFIVD